MHTFQINTHSIFDAFYMFQTSWVHPQEDCCMHNVCVVCFTCIGARMNPWGSKRVEDVKNWIEVLTWKMCISLVCVSQCMVPKKMIVLLPSYNYNRFCQLYFMLYGIGNASISICESYCPVRVVCKLTVHFEIVLIGENRLQHSTAKTQLYGNSSWVQLVLRIWKAWTI
jgi:hypothetical protein